MINKLVFYIVLLLLFFASAGNLSVAGLKISTTIASISIILFLLSKYKINPATLFCFFIISIIYTFSLDLIDNRFGLVFITRISYLVLTFYLIDFWKKTSVKEEMLLLKSMNYGFFLFNFIVLILLVAFPAYSEMVVLISKDGIRLSGFFDQPNGYAIIFCISIPISVYFLISSKNIIYSLPVLINAICAILTQSRGLLASLILSFGITFILLKIATRDIKKIIISFAAFFFILLIFIGILVLLPDYLSDKYGISLGRFNADHEASIMELSSYDITSERIPLLSRSLETLANHPFGIGFIDNHKAIGETTMIYLLPHNMLASYLLQSGIIFGSLWIITLLYIILKSLKHIYRNKIGPNDIFYYYTTAIIAVTFYITTHSTEWLYMYLIFGITYGKILALKESEPENCSQFY